MSRLLRFFRASRRERSIFVKSFFLVALYRIALWVLPFGIAKSWALGYAEPDSKELNDGIVVDVVRGVRYASRFIPAASCLTQALAARNLLARNGQRADLKIGVAKSKGEFEAHAWLEIDGRIILGKQRMHSRFFVLTPNEGVFDQRSRATSSRG